MAGLAAFACSYGGPSVPHCHGGAKGETGTRPSISSARQTVKWMAGSGAGHDE